MSSSGRERHVGTSQPDRAPYPSRAIRTADFLLIRNFKPERLPMGVVYKENASEAELLEDHYLAYPDMDGSPTKAFVMTHRDEYPQHFDFAFAARPEFELYDLEKDPDQIDNVAAEPEYADVLQELTDRLMRLLRETGDPRVIGDGTAFDRKPFVDPTFVPEPKKKKELNF